MKRNTTAGTLQPRPKFFNSMPRRKGILLAKARTYRWTACNWYLNFIKAQGISSSLCTTCKVEDTVRHVIDNCKMHEDDREKTLLKIGHAGKMSDLLSSSDTKVIDLVADFLINTEDKRIAMRKQEVQRQAQI